MRKALPSEVVAALISFVGGIAVTVVAAVLNPLVSQWLGGEGTAALQQKVEADKNQSMVQAQRIAELEGALEKETARARRRISFEMALLSEKVDEALVDGTSPTFDVLGINALGPLHQGMETILKILGNGGTVRILLLDPESKTFQERSEDERDCVGRIAAELQASMFICANVLDRLRRNPPEKPFKLEVRLRDKYPDRSLLLINAKEEKGVIVENVYPPPYEGKRGLEGPSYTWFKFRDGTVYEQKAKLFEDTWEAGIPVDMTKYGKYPWFFWRPTATKGPNRCGS